MKELELMTYNTPSHPPYRTWAILACFLFPCPTGVIDVISLSQNGRVGDIFARVYSSRAWTFEPVTR